MPALPFPGRAERLLISLIRGENVQYCGTLFAEKARRFFGIFSEQEGRDIWVSIQMSPFPLFFPSIGKRISDMAAPGRGEPSYPVLSGHPVNVA